MSRRSWYMSGAKENIPFYNRLDTVRVRVTPETEALSLAGLTGQVCSETVPSANGVFQADIVGNLTEDYAVSVRFGELFREYWFARGSLELVDQSSAAEEAGGRETKTWLEDGCWTDEIKRRGRLAKFWAWSMIIVIACVVLVMERLQGS